MKLDCGQLFAAQLESVIGVTVMGPSSLAAPPSSPIVPSAVASGSEETSSPEPEAEPDVEPEEDDPDEEFPLVEEGPPTPGLELQLAAAIAIDTGTSSSGRT
jgi:hypothetical protein